MTKQAVAAIKQAEEQAEVLCRVAAEKAAEMKARITKEGLAHCERTEAEAEAEYRARTEEIRAKANALIEKKRNEALSEAAALAATAELHMEEAVKQIIWGIVEKCQ